VQIIVGLEKHFNIQFDPETIMDMEDVSDIVAAVEERIK
jgi:acyl carrier protein